MKRTIGLFLVLAMVLAMLPATVFAADGTAAAQSDYPVIELGTVTAAVIENEGDTAYFAFTPTVTEIYAWSSSGSMDTYGYICDADGNQILSDDDSGEGSNFWVRTSLEAGVTYLLAAKYYSDDVTGSIDVTLNALHDYVQDAVLVEATCQQSGQVRYVCDNCGDSYIVDTGYAEHSYVETAVLTAPTCMEDGESEFTCSVCGEVSTMAVSATGHTFSDGVCVVCGMDNVLDVGEQTRISITSGGQSVRFVVTAETSGAYLAWSPAAIAATIYDAQGDFLDSETHTEDLRRGEIWYMEAGETYEISVGYNDYTYTGSFDLIVEQIPYIESDVNTTAEIVNGYSALFCYEAVADEDYTFKFVTGENRNTFGYARWIGESGSSGSSSSWGFKVNGTMTAGRHYVFETGFSEAGLSGSYTVILDVAHEYSSEITTPNSCTEDGLMTYTCTLCGDVYTEVIPAAHTTVNGFCTVCGVEDIMDQGTCSDGLNWKITTDGILTIYGSGPMADYSSYDNTPPWSDYKYDITSVIIEEGVTSIGSYAFYEADLSSLSLPEGLIAIGDRAFMYCDGLSALTIPGSVETIGNFAFYYCQIRPALTIPGNVKTIGDYAFTSCYRIETLTLAEGIVHIGDFAFQGCENLTQVTIPSTVTHMSGTAFMYCDSLETFTVSADNEAYISADDMVFTRDRTVLMWVTPNVEGEFVIPETVRVIDDGALTGHSAMTSVVFPEGLQEIGAHAFRGCSGLERVEIPEGVTSIGEWGFYACNSLKVLSLPASLAGMGSLAFEWCMELEELYIADVAAWCAVEIGDQDAGSKANPMAYAQKIYFEGQLATELVIPEGVTSIGDYVFGDAKQVDRVTLPTTLTEIGANAFSAMDTLTVVFQGDAPTFRTRTPEWSMAVQKAFNGTTVTAYYPADNATWTEEVLTGDYGGSITWIPMETVATGWSGYTEWTLTSDGRMTVSGEGAMRNYTYKSEMPWYAYADQITDVVIEDGVTSVGDYAFYGMGIESITIPETVTAIGDYAFKGCTALDGVALPAGLTKLGESAFYGCTSLSAIDIPASLWTVQPYTFKNCTALATATFHEGNLMKISDGAFYGTALTAVELPDCLSILDVYVFKNCANLASVTLGGGITQIREASLYGTAISEIAIPEGVTVIKPYAFKNCVNLVSVDLPSTLTTVDEAAFYACTALESITLPDTVTTIGNYAFRKCTGLTALTFGSGLSDIGESSFYGCTGLTELVIPENVTTIQAYAFKGCTAVASVSLPDALVTIGDSAFHTCTGLKTIVIPANVKTIGAYCFSGSWNLWQLTFQGDAPTIGTSAFKSLVATAYYPGDNTTWTADIMQNYGGTITWTAQ